MKLFNYVLTYLTRGLPLFPCGPDKKPLTPHGFKDASRDADVIRDWWKRWPEALIGLPTGEGSGIVVLDVDQDQATGKDGEASLAKLFADRGVSLPSTRVAKTPRGGRHLYFKHPGCRVPSRVNWPAASLDVRGDGGYVIMPPSRSEVGEYAWLANVESAALPHWLKELLVQEAVDPTAQPATRAAQARRAVPRWADDLECSGAPSGERNAQTFKLACQFRDSGLTENEAAERIVGFASRCSPPLPLAEALTAVRSAFTQPPRPPANVLRRRTGGLISEYLPSETNALELPEPEKWPDPVHPAAFHGLAGEVVRTIEPHTEADPAALLVMFMAAFGNMAGPGAHFLAEARRHPGRLWPVLVGETAKGRKGSAWSSLRHVLGLIDENWCAHRLASGLSSGEGLIWAVRDPIMRTQHSKDGGTESVQIDEGIADKRLLCIEEEFSSVLKVSAREANIISDVLRRAWDDGNLRTLTKNSPAKATGAHITVVGHITKSELGRLLTETDTLNGFGNRFLWLAVRRSKLLPDGGSLHKLQFDDLVLKLRRALDHARTCSELPRTPAARDFWHAVYPVLTRDRPGLLGAITNRAEAQVMRAALLYALLDCKTEIDVEHLRAGLALWDYCEHSSRFIFGDSLGDRVADRLAESLQAAGDGGLTLTQIRDLFERNESSKRISTALSLLERQGLARSTKQPSGDNGGRPTVIWKWVHDQNDINDGTPGGKPVKSYSSFLSLEGRCEPGPTGGPVEAAPVAIEPEEEVYV